LAGHALEALLKVAESVASAKGAVATLAVMPVSAFALMVAGGLWLCLWTTAPRLFGLVPLLAGAILTAASPGPDLLVTGDGRHLAVVAEGGTPLMLRDRSGDFMRSLMSEASGFDEEPGLLDGAPLGSCSRDACVAAIQRDGWEWRVLATRSTTRLDWAPLVQACAQADIVVSERRLPRGCTPRWLKLDRETLGRTGGVAVFLGPSPRVDTVADRLGAHPWAHSPAM
jgi:competence protein ComEC